MGKDTIKFIQSFIKIRLIRVKKIVTNCAKPVTKKPVPSASHFMTRQRHYDRLLLGNLAHFINHLTLLTLVRQNNVPYVTLA